MTRWSFQGHRVTSLNYTQSLSLLLVVAKSSDSEVAVRVRSLPTARTWTPKTYSKTVSWSTCVQHWAAFYFMPDGRVRAMARVIAIEGIDGAGKSTLIDAPAAELPAPTVRLADDGLW